MSKDLAPIILFVYNRPQHSKETLRALAANEYAKESLLYVYCDGAKKGATNEELEKIKEVRQLVKAEKGFKEVVIHEREQNKGLANSIIEGVTEIVNKHGKVIVLEDDLVTSAHFLQFMNDALNVYESNDNVACISGYIYPAEEKSPETFFIKGADCWGWATWKDAWSVFEKDGKKLLNELEQRSLTDSFDFDRTYPYTQMLKDQIKGKVNSWAIRWYASAFLKDKYCLYPGKSLVQNIGIDGSGEHSGVSKNWNVELAKNKVNVNAIPVEENDETKKAIMAYFKRIIHYNPSLYRKVVNKLKHYIRK